ARTTPDRVEPLASVTLTRASSSSASHSDESLSMSSWRVWTRSACCAMTFCRGRCCQPILRGGMSSRCLHAAGIRSRLRARCLAFSSARGAPLDELRLAARGGHAGATRPALSIASPNARHAHEPRPQGSPEVPARPRRIADRTRRAQGSRKREPGRGAGRDVPGQRSGVALHSGEEARLSMAGGDAPAALLVIDMISLLDFPQAERMTPRAVAAARKIQRLRRGFHDRDWPVVFANDNFARWRSDFHEQVAMAVHEGGAPADIASRLDPGPRDHFVLKPKRSAFLATPLGVLLAKLGVRRLLLTGMALEGCVLATAIDAHSREFEVAVVRDAVAGLPELAAPSLKVLEGSGVARLVASRAALGWAAG